MPKTTKLSDLNDLRKLGLAQRLPYILQEKISVVIERPIETHNAM